MECPRNQNLQFRVGYFKILPGSVNKRGVIFVVPDMTGLRQGLELLVITRMVVGVQIQDLVLGLGAPLPTNSLVEIEPN